MVQTYETKGRNRPGSGLAGLGQKGRDICSEGGKVAVRLRTEEDGRIQLQTAKAEEGLGIQPRRAVDEPDMEGIAVDRVDKLGDLHDGTEHHSKFSQRKPPDGLYKPTFFGYNKSSGDRFHCNVACGI